MNGIWFLKWPLIIFFIGFLVRLVGALWKIRHWPMGDELLTIGFVICGIAVVFAIVKLLLMKKPVE